MEKSASVWHKMAEDIFLDNRSIAIRKKIVEILSCSKRGHIGSSFSLVEIMRVLYDNILRYDEKDPKWENRDRCILSKGHGCLALYVMLAEKGFFPTEELNLFCKKGALLGGHPDSTKIPGVEASTGSLGHGLPIGLGMAVNARFEKSDSRVFVILGDGECNEGSIWEAAMSAGKHHLSRLTVLIDYNKYQSYDSTSYVQELEPFADKWRSFGFGVTHVNGHDSSMLLNVLNNLPVIINRPSAVICHTVKGKGVAFAENNVAWHHKSGVEEKDINSLIEALEEYKNA